MMWLPGVRNLNWLRQKSVHLLEGFMIILDNLDEAIQIIRDSKTPDEARTRLMERFGLSEIQSRAVVECVCVNLRGWSKISCVLNMKKFESD